jgi:N-acetylglucosaminyldiphosphoundecaprenol N-acetyl-beta-D-mannosaminyltransferase
MEHMTELTRAESSLRQTAVPLTWPRKYPLFGVDVSCTTYDEVVNVVSAAAQCGRPGRVSALAVHGLMTGSAEAPFREALNDFEVITPDGQPVRVALNLLHRTNLTDRVYGPELMVRLCERAAAEEIGIYLYGSFAAVVDRLASQLVARFPRLRIAGAEPSIFRPLTPEEDDALVRRINESGAGMLFVGLGCPRQEWFAHEHRSTVIPVQVCVGAAFDFIAGNKPMAPQWMQQHGLEWLFRLAKEPRRLWRRYTYTNLSFILKLAREMIARRA